MSPYERACSDPSPAVLSYAHVGMTLFVVEKSLKERLCGGLQRVITAVDSSAYSPLPGGAPAFAASGHGKRGHR